MNKLIALYIPIVDYMADSLGTGYEIALYEVADVLKTILIRNGYISERAVFSAIPEVLAKIVENDAVASKPYYTINFLTEKARRLVKLNVYCIRDESNRLVGLLSIGKSSDFSSEFSGEINVFIDKDNKAKVETAKTADAKFYSNESPLRGNPFQPGEMASKSMEELVDRKISELTPKIGDGGVIMTKTRREEIIEELRQSGVFKIKGAIPKVARLLKTSETTVYRYLRLIENDNEKHDTWTYLM